MTETQRQDADDGRDETPFERADRNWNEILQEVRVTQTSTQILGGFLLAVAFQPRFTELDDYQRVLYLTLVALAGLSTALGLALVALHRRYFGKRQKIRVVRVGSRLLSANLAIVAVLAAGVTGLIFDFVHGHIAGFVALGASLVVTLGLWVVLPLAGGSRSEDQARHEATGSAGSIGIADRTASAGAVRSPEENRIPHEPS